MVQADAVSCGDKGSSDALKVRGWRVCVGGGGGGGLFQAHRIGEQASASEPPQLT